MLFSMQFTFTLVKCEGSPAVIWLHTGTRSGGKCISIPLFSSSLCGEDEQAKNGKEWCTPAAEQLRDHDVPSRWASAALDKVNVLSIFSPDPWLTLMGSFILMLIGGHGEGGSSLHFFWSNLPPLEPSTFGWMRVWSLEWIQMDGMDPCQWFEWVLAISFSSSPFHLGRWSFLSCRLLKPGWKCPGASSSAKKLPWKGSPNWSRHWNITVHHTSSHRQIFVVFCLAHQLLHWVKCVPTMVWVTSYFSR